MTADLAGFLLARITEDEAAVNDRTRHLAPGGWSYLEQFGDFGDDERWMIEIPAARVLAECEAKRRIVEIESRWRTTKDVVLASSGPDYNGRISVTWRPDWSRPSETEIVSAQEFRERFTEPSPPSETLRLLALPYASHPDYRDEWRP